MIHDLSLSGVITIKFDCGCSIILEIFYEENSLTGMNRRITPLVLKSCPQHKNTNSDKIDWVAVVEKAMKEHNCITYFELLDEYDSVVLNDNLNTFICDTSTKETEK